MKFIKDTTTKFGELLVLGDNMRLEEDTDGRTRISSTGIGVSNILDDLSDVTISAVANNQALIYNAATSQWKNTLISAPMISSGVFGTGSFAFQSTLDVVGNLKTSGQLRVNVATASQATVAFAKLGTDQWQIYVPGSSTELRFWDGTTDRVRFFNGGAVVIGTDPGSTEILRVGGSIHAATAGGGTFIAEDSVEAHYRLTKTGTGANVSYLFSSATSLGWFDSTNARHTFYIDRSDNSFHYPTGPVILGSDPGGTEPLRVGGAVRIGSSITQIGTSVEQDFKRTDGGADSKTWNWFPESTAFAGRILNDARSVGVNWLEVHRSGMTVTSVQVPNSPLVAQSWLYINNTGLKGVGGGFDARPALIWGSTDVIETWFLGPTTSTTKANTIMGIYSWQLLNFSQLWYPDGTVLVGTTDPGGGATLRVGGTGRFSSGPGTSRATQLGLGLFQDSTTMPLFELQTADSDTTFGEDALFIYSQRWGANIWLIHGGVSGDRSYGKFSGSNGYGEFFLFDASALTGGNIKVWMRGTDGQTILGNDPGGSALLRVGGDIRIGANLGIFDSTSTPLTDYLLSYNGTKWVARFLQTSFTNGNVTSGVLSDGTTISLVNDGRTLSGTPSAPGAAPVVTAVYKGLIVDISAYGALPAGQKFVIDYSINSGSTFTTDALITIGNRVVHSNLHPEWGYVYKYKVRGATDSAYSSNSTITQPTYQAEVNAFGLITASQITTVNLSAISADIGDITAGRIQNSVLDAGIRLSQSYAVAPTWKTYLDLYSGIMVVKDNQGAPVTRVQVGRVGAGTTDYGLQVFDSLGGTIMDMTGAKRILAVPVQDQGAKKTSNYSLDLSSGLTMRVQLGLSNLLQTTTGMVNGGRYRIIYQQDETGSRGLPTFIDANSQPLAVEWVGGTPETPSTTAGLYDVYEFEYRTAPTSRFAAMLLKKGITPIFPTLAGTNPTTTSIAVAATAHNINMPATVTNKDVLVMICGYNLGSVATTPTGWTLTGSAPGPNVGERAIVFTKIADGTEGGTTVGVTTAANCVMAAHVYRFQNAYQASASGACFMGSANVGTSTNPDPAGAVPGWTDQTSWLSVDVHFSNASVSVYPTNYTNGSSTVASTLVSTATARRIGFYAVSDDPGTYTIGAAVDWVAFTLAVRPPA